MIECDAPSAAGHPDAMNVEMRFKVGVADHVVEGEGFWADDVAEIGVNHIAIDAALEPELN